MTKIIGNKADKRTAISPNAFFIIFIENLQKVLVEKKQSHVVPMEK